MDEREFYDESTGSESEGNFETEIYFGNPKEHRSSVVMYNDKELLCEIEHFPNPDVVEFHSPFEISKVYIEIFNYPLREGYDEAFHKIGKMGREIVSKVFEEISGITSITIRPYSFSITKAKCFSFKQIEREVIKILREQKDWIETKKLIGRENSNLVE